MCKKIVMLAMALVFVVGLAGISSAADVNVYGQIVYGGYVMKTSEGEPFGTVKADTGIFVFNPYRGSIAVIIGVYDKHGTMVYRGPLYDGLLEGQVEPRITIPPNGWGWITLGMTRIPPGPATKYTFKLSTLCSSVVPSRMPVVEVKEVIYNGEVSPIDIFNPDQIRTWSETSLGGNSGTGYFAVP